MRADAQAFAKVFSDTSEAGVILRRAYNICKNSAYESLAQDQADSEAACRELSAIGKKNWPSLTPAQRFARAFETNPELAKRAHKRPSVFSTSYPHPAVAKAMPLTNTTPATQPVFTTETDPVNPEQALAQLKEIGRQRWPSASAAQQFMNAVTDVNNADLVTAALRPTGSSPARQ